MGGKLPTQTYHDIVSDKSHFETLRGKLKLKQLKTKREFAAKYPKAHQFLTDRGLEFARVRQHSAKVISAGALTGALLLSPPHSVKGLPAPQEVFKNVEDPVSLNPVAPQKELVQALKQNLPEKVRPLTRSEEKTLEQIFVNTIGIPARATLEGEHLNTTYGRIGAEQHLLRYPGDSISQHGTGGILKEGIAPGKGAWGYFAPSRTALSPDLTEKEKWYAVVQTLYLPDWGSRQPYLRDWYKFRKVLIVNTDNGNAVVAAIADSGPAAWTGKHFGGSPEVMHYLGGPRYKKGPVVLFFVDDPENKIPLGPVEYNELNLPVASLEQT